MKALYFNFFFQKKDRCKKIAINGKHVNLFYIVIDDVIAMIDKVHKSMLKNNIWHKKNILFLLKGRKIFREMRMHTTHYVSYSLKL